MTRDIRFPIGLLFSVTGIILVVYGLISDPSIYHKSMGFNINLWWGLGLVVFGGIMLALAIMFGEKPLQSEDKAEGDQ